MQFADWVPEDVRDQHSKLEGHLGISRENMSKILSSNDENIRKTWELIGKNLKRLNKKSDDEKALILENNDNICQHTVGSEELSDSTLSRMWKSYYGSTYDFLYLAMIQSSDELPKWLCPEKIDLGFNRQKEFLEFKRSLISLKAFIQKVDVDFQVFDLGNFDPTIALIDTNVRAMFGELNSLTKQVGPLESIDTLRSNLHQLMERKRKLNEIKVSGVFEQMISGFNFIQNCEINLAIYNSYGNSERNNFIYKLAECFNDFLGGPRYEHVTNITQVVFGLSSLDKNTVKNEHKRISKLLGGKSI